MHAHTRMHAHTHIHTYTHIKVHIAEEEGVFWAKASYRLIQLWDAVTGQLDFVDKVALVSFCGLCRLGSVDGAELREGKYHQKGRSVLADNFCPTRLLLHGQSCYMPLGLPIRAKRVRRWHRSRHDSVWRHIWLSPADDRNKHFTIFFFFLFFLIYCTAFFSGWYFSNTFWDNLLPGRLVPFHRLRHLLSSVGSCTAFHDEWYSRWKRRATLWLHAWPSLLKHGRKKKKLKHFRKR